MKFQMSHIPIENGKNDLSLSMIFIIHPIHVSFHVVFSLLYIDILNGEESEKMKR